MGRISAREEVEHVEEVGDAVVILEVVARYTEFNKGKPCSESREMHLGKNECVELLELANE